MTLTSSPSSVIESLLVEAGELRRYGFGQELIPAGEPPSGVWLIQKGSVRSLAPLPPTGNWRTVERHETGSLVGWLGLLQEQPFEHLRTADLTEALFIPADRFLTLWEQEQLSGAGVLINIQPAVVVAHLSRQFRAATPTGGMAMAA